MNKENFVKLEETVNRYLNSENEDYVNDFNHMVKVFDDYAMNDGKLVDKVVKHYYNKLLVDGKLAKDYTSYDKQQVINGKTVLEQWVGAVENEKRIEYLTLFNSIYQKANIPTKVCLYGHKERKNVEFAKAMQLRGEKVKKEDFNVNVEDDEVNSLKKAMSDALTTIDSIGEATRFKVSELMDKYNEIEDEELADNVLEQSRKLLFDYYENFNDLVKSLKPLFASIPRNDAANKESTLIKKYRVYLSHALFHFLKFSGEYKLFRIGYAVDFAGGEVSLLKYLLNGIIIQDKQVFYKTLYVVQLWEELCFANKNECNELTSLIEQVSIMNQTNKEDAVSFIKTYIQEKGK
jgi:hypothetical protein